jgi:hypothetical protein
MTVRFLVGNDTDAHIAKVGNMDRTSGDVFSDVANADRLAAAWNACEAIPTAELAPGLVVKQNKEMQTCVELLRELCLAAVALRETRENSTVEPSDVLINTIDWTDVHIRDAQEFLGSSAFGVGQTQSKEDEECDPALNAPTSKQWCDDRR